MPGCPACSPGHGRHGACSRRPATRATCLGGSVVLSLPDEAGAHGSLLRLRVQIRSGAGPRCARVPGGRRCGERPRSLGRLAQPAAAGAAAAARGLLRMVCGGFGPVDVRKMAGCMATARPPSAQAEATGHAVASVFGCGFGAGGQAASPANSGGAQAACSSCRLEQGLQGRGRVARVGVVLSFAEVALCQQTSFSRDAAMCRNPCSGVARRADCRGDQFANIAGSLCFRFGGAATFADARCGVCRGDHRGPVASLFNDPGRLV